MSPATLIVTCLMAMGNLVRTSESKTVIIIPYPNLSHTKYHTNIARSLAERGHHVWVAMSTSVSQNDYLDTSGFNIIPFETIPGLEERTRKLMSDSYFEGTSFKFFDFTRLTREVVGDLLKNESFLSTIKEKRPDLIVVDNFFVFYPISVIPYRLRIPFAFVGSSYHAPTMRVPFSPAEVPFAILPYTNQMSFMQRLHSTLFFMLFSVYNPSFQTDVVATYAPEMEFLPLDLLITRAEVFIVESDHILDYPKPTLPNVKLIGGTAPRPAKVLPPEFQSFMDSAKEGVVIVSFGTYVLGLPKHISDKILEVLLQLPMKSVFRSNLTSPDPKKILTAPWIPQNDLLGHPHTKVFVSHCGKNGQYEALYHAVPIVATPLFADQRYNAERVREKGFAEVLDLNTCTTEQMRSTILTVANEPRYKQAVVKRSRLFRELYGVPMETAAYWLDHVMEYGGDYMRSAGQQMPLYQYLLLDVFLFILCVVALTVGLLCVCITTLYRCCCKRKVKAD
ncbi:UDP-glucuronosyltransferase 2B4-like [Babylonia areolata]|uniref:UDP-glucuronosyltransferase 2B4-like n=1 Tax=Babylonia areolata TaxID=304850 RepID=UPI003FD140C8